MATARIEQFDRQWLGTGDWKDVASFQGGTAITGAASAGAHAARRVVGADPRGVRSGSRSSSSCCRCSVRANRLRDGRGRLVQVSVGLPEVEAWSSRGATQLSVGQQKLVALARALVVGRRLLLLDEPFEGVAAALAEEMGGPIGAARDEDGVACLLAESEHREVELLAERLYTIERGAAA